MAPSAEEDDPELKVEFRRELRKGFRDLRSDARERKDLLIDPKSKALAETVARSDELFSKVKRARELNEDAITYVEIVGSAVEMAKRLGPRGAAAYHPREFCGRLCGVFVNGWDPQSQAVDDPGSFRWEVLGSQVSPFFAEAPACSFMNGAMDTQVKERRVAQRVRRDAPVGPVSNPDAVDDTLTEQQTDHNMKRMAKILKHKTKAGERVSAQRLASNPASFAQFVENVFTLSFLVKDGEAGLEPPEEDATDRSATVLKRQKPEEQHVERSTFVMHLDVKGWRALVENNGGAEGVMPHREEAPEPEVREMEGARGGRGASVGAGGAGGPEATATAKAEAQNGGSAGKRKAQSARPKDVTNSQERDDAPKRRRRVAGEEEDEN